MKSQTNIFNGFLPTLLLGTTMSWAQSDTLIFYDVRSTEKYVVLNRFVDSSTNFDNTQWNYGNVAGFTSLSLQPPSDPFPGSGFTDYKPAHNFFPITNYPARIAVKLFRFSEDSLRQICSGTLVAEDLVLTSSHCLYNFFDTTMVPRFADSILAVPAYDNAMEQHDFGSSISQAFIIPKANLRDFLSQDIALVQLREPIGLKTGWTGIAFSSDNTFFHNKAFHKFSYPGTVDHSDSSRNFNGDTLYYNYGTLDFITDNYLGYNIEAIPGRSGSSLLYTDNVQFLAMGTCSFSYQSMHTRLTRGLFYAFKDVIERVRIGVGQDHTHSASYVLMNPYPNPFNPTTTISFSIPKKSIVHLRLYDALGRQVTILQDGMVDAGIYKITFNGSKLASGIYFLRMDSINFINVKKIVLLK
jgi:V8-like Glu-specific endopeptidase